MLSRPTNLKAAAFVGLLLFAFTGCYSPRPGENTPPAPAKTKYSPTYDAEINEVMKLARDNRWEDAQVKATELAAKDPKSPILQRVKTWVDSQAQLRRAQALEDQIRSIDAKNSVFSPTPKSLLKEQRDRGLPPRKDVRDVVDKIESSTWIPETYGKTVHESAPLFDLESAKGRMAKELEKEVTVHLDNVPLESVLIYLSQNSGVNIVADKALPSLKQVLSVNLDKVRLGELFRYVERNYELQFQIGDGLVWVTDGKDPKKMMEETRFYRLRKGFVLPAGFGSETVQRAKVTVNNVTTVTESDIFKKFVNDEAPIQPSLERAIKDLWTGSKWMIDYERNLVVARGTPEQHDVLAKIIEEFDRPIQQVLIEARFVTVSKPAFMQLGVLWESGRHVRAARVPYDPTGFLTSQQASYLGIGIQEMFTNVLGASDLTATITALEQTGESQTLSAPRLTVLNNRPATISDGKVQYYYEEYQVKSTVQERYTSSAFVPSGKPTKITAGAELDVMASVSGDGRSILLALHPRVNTDVQLVKFATISDFNAQGDLQSTFDINLPQYRTQELATRMVVKSGDTVVMGGVLERQRYSFVESVPVLGDIPILGALFRRRTENDTPRYLLVFVTATIVKDTGEFLVLDDTATPEASSNGSSSEVKPGAGSLGAGLPESSPATITNSITSGTGSAPAAPEAAQPPAPAAAPVTTPAPPPAANAPATTNASPPQTAAPVAPPATNAPTPPK